MSLFFEQATLQDESKEVRDFLRHMLMECKTKYQNETWFELQSTVLPPDTTSGKAEKQKQSHV